MAEKTAIVLGATGLTGSKLLDILLAHSDYKKILVFSRTALSETHPKLDVIVCDLLELEQQKEQFVADEVFCCIGTTMKKTPDKKLYHKIDFGIPVTAANLCAANKIETLITVSSMGANAKSSIFYSRTKGEMQNALLSKKIKNTYFLQPSFIGGNRSENRSGEKMGIRIFKFLQPILIGPLRKLRLIEAETIAKAMVLVAQKGYKKSILASDEIQKLVDLDL